MKVRPTLPLVVVVIGLLASALTPRTARSHTLMASGGDRPVTNGDGGSHSVFAVALLRGLRKMDGPRFTASELFGEYVIESVAGRAVCGERPLRRRPGLRQLCLPAHGGEARGYDVRAVEVSEFAKAEGAMTCMSLLFRQP